MATRTVKAGAGNFNATGSWVEGQVPGSGDDVVTDALSTGTLVINVASACRSYQIGNGVAVTHTSTLTIGDASGGALNYTGAGAITGAGVVSFVSTSNNGGTGWGVTSAGKVLPAITFNGAGGKWVLQDALACGAMNVTSGTFDSNNQTISCASFVAGGTVTRTVTLGSSSITSAGQFTARFSSLTWTANTATVTLSSSTTNFGVSTVSDGDFNGLSVVMTGAGEDVLIGSGTITVNSLSRTGTAAKTDGFSLQADLVCTGTFTATGNSKTNRLLVKSNAVGTPRTITAATVVSNGADFQDIVGSGAGSWNLGAASDYSGDGGGNSGITLTTTATQTWNSTSGGNTSDVSKWTSRVPLPQDDVVIAGAFVASQTITGDMPRLGKDISMSTSGSPLIVSTSAAWALYGSLTVGASVTFGGGSLGTFSGRGTHTISVSGSLFSGNNLTIDATGSYTLATAITMGLDRTFSVLQGTFDTANFTMTLGLFTSTGSSARSVTLGTSTINLHNTAASSPLSITASALLSAAASIIVLASVSNNTRIFAGGGLVYGTLRYNVADSAGQLTFTGSNTFAIPEFGSGRTILFTPGTTQNFLAWDDVNGEIRDHIYLPGASTATLTTPNAAALELWGDLELRIALAAADWSPSAINRLVSKYVTNASGYELYLATSGALTFQRRAGGGNRTIASTATVGSTGVADGGAILLRVAFDVDNGAAQSTAAFYHKAFNASTYHADLLDNTGWTALGTTVTDGSTAATTSNTAALTIGTSASAVSPLTGKFYAAAVLDAIAGNVVFDADVADKTFGANTFVEGSANAATVTLNGLATVGDGRLVFTTGGAAAVIARPTVDDQAIQWNYWGTTITMTGDGVVLPGTTDNYVSHPVSLIGTGDLDIIVDVAMTDWTPATDMTFVARSGNSSGNRGLRFAATNTTGLLRLSYSLDGSNFLTASASTATGFTDATRHRIRVTRVASTGVIKFYEDIAGVWTQIGTDVAGTAGALFVYDRETEIGSYSSGTLQPAAGTFYEVEIRDGIDGAIIANPRFGRAI